MPFYPSDLLSYLGGGVANAYRGMMPPLPKSEEEERKEREQFLAQQSVPAWTEAEVNNYLQRAIAAEQKNLAAQQTRATAATPQRRSYPIDAYGSTPEERIRTIQNLNAQESQGEAITEQSGPPMDMIQTAMNYGMPTYNPQEVEIFHSRPRYEFSPDLGPQQAHADANMAHAANDRERNAIARARQEAVQRDYAQNQPFVNAANMATALKESGDNPAALKSFQQQQELMQMQMQMQKQQMEKEMQQQMLRQQMQMRRPTLPVTGRPLSLLEMIQYGQIA